jgi:DNA-binding CsgD family transcriptional regulator
MLLDFLDHICCGGLLVDAEGPAISLNEAAYRILSESSAIPFHPQDSAQVRQSLERMLGCEIRRLREEHFFVVRRKDERWPIVVRVFPPRALDASVVVVVLLDLNIPPQLDAGSVQKAFGLTAAEANLAIEIARGRTLTEISRSQGISVNTVRGHLTAVLSKTHTRRQAELSALLARFSLISS